MIAFKKRHHQHWFSENDIEISELLSKKNTVYAVWFADPKSGYKREHFASLCKTGQTHLCGRVLAGGKLSNPFSVTKGVKQGPILGFLAPLLFILFYAAMIKEATSKTTVCF